MKRRRAALISVLAGLLLSASAEQRIACKRVATPLVQWSRCANDSLWVLETQRPLEILFAPTAVRTLRRWAERRPDVTLLLNGGYHDGDYAEPTMAGLLELDGKVVSALKPGDTQLSRVFSLDGSGRLVGVEPADARQPTSVAARMQTGPAILLDGQLAAKEITASANGRDPYKRTAIGRTRDGTTVIVVARTPRTLAELGTMLRRINAYRRRKLTLINLDGGPSTAIHSPDVPALSYGADKVTPILIAVRR